MTESRGEVRIFRESEIEVVDRGNGIRSVPFASGETGSKHLLTGMTIFPPGGAIALHTHSAEESVVVLEGEAVCEVAAERHRLKPFEATYIGAGLPHRFVNVGATQMRILWIYGSIDTKRTIIATGETTGPLGSYPGKRARRSAGA